MSAKRKVEHIEAPKTNDRIEQLRYLARLRGEVEEEKPKLNTKRFLIISAIIVAILVAGLVFTTSKINEINLKNEDVYTRLRQESEAASELDADLVKATALAETKIEETMTAVNTARAAVAANQTKLAARTEALENAKDNAADKSTVRTLEIIRLVLIVLLIAAVVAAYISLKGNPAARKKKSVLIGLAAILAVLLIGVVVLGSMASSMENRLTAASAVTETSSEDEEAADAEAAQAAQPENAAGEIDSSISTWNLARFAIIVLLIVYAVFMLVKLAHPKRRKPNRSFWGDFGIYFMMAVFAVAMVFPLVFSIAASLKPLDELFRVPPKVFAQHPTMDNFADLFVTLGQSYVPFSRYLTNTVLITFIGTFGHVLIASMAAFVLAKYEFPGSRTFFSIVVTALMFTGYVTGIPNYVIMSRIGIIDTYWAIILPAFAAPIGLFLMKQFMEGLPTALIEAAHLDGAGEFRIFWSIVMPNVKPAWLTIIIFSVQSLWNTNAATVIYTEKNKTLVYALQQIQAGGIARTGQAAAVTVIVMVVPIIIFILSQSRILETMASSGLKD